MPEEISNRLQIERQVPSIKCDEKSIEGIAPNQNVVTADRMTDENGGHGCRWVEAAVVGSHN